MFHVSPHSFLACFLVFFVILQDRVCDYWGLVRWTQHYPVKYNKINNKLQIKVRDPVKKTSSTRCTSYISIAWKNHRTSIKPLTKQWHEQRELFYFHKLENQFIYLASFQSSFKEIAKIFAMFLLRFIWYVELFLHFDSYRWFIGEQMQG